MRDEPVHVIGGIQQLGLGVVDAEAAFTWYRRHLGFDVRMFDDRGDAPLMVRYTGGRVHRRRAILALNLRGGAGLEIWQFIDREPARPRHAWQLGDRGIFAARVKSDDLTAARARLVSSGVSYIGNVEDEIGGRRQLWLCDPFGNWLQLVESDDWFGRGRTPIGGVCGCWIGVSDIDRALPLYRDVLGFERVIADSSGVFPDLHALPGAGEDVRRVRLAHTPRGGPFSVLLGAAEIELIQSLIPRTPSHLYAGRYWGDPGFIHLCLDISGLDAFKERCAATGFPLTVDSQGSFAMEEAAGRFAYLEDPDGTLIELVETHRIPILKKLGLYVDLRRRRADRPLPSLFLKALAFNRVKDA